MALLNTSSLIGAVLLLYLSSFVLFAIIRIATGVSIQRIGYLSLRHISYTPKEGFRIDIRGLGLSLHRPSFAQPTWISLVLTELKITLDPDVLGGQTVGPQPQTKKPADSPDEKNTVLAKRTSLAKPTKGRSQLWRRLTNIKERIKRIHRKIHWLRMLDIVAVNTTFEVVGAGSAHLSSFTMAVHTRRKLLDRGRLFRHKKDPTGDQHPAEWIFTLRSVLLNVAGNEPLEILDVATMNVHGILYKDREGLRDTSIAVKAGRLYIPIDDLLLFAQRSKSAPNDTIDYELKSPIEEISFEDYVGELDSPGSREASIVQTVADSKEFLSSTLESVQEIQLALSFIRVSKEVESLRRSNQNLVMNVVTHEIGVDLHRLDQSTPAHRMYFSPKDIAHQALVAAISISLSLDEDDSNSNKIMYVPMATVTVKTTLPSKTMNFTEDRDVAERNTNILFGNLVVTSPSIDLTPRHLAQLLAIAQLRTYSASKSSESHHRLISRLLPKASVKLSVHEPVLRFVLPVADPDYCHPGDYDMIISAVSSISLDLESSYSAGGELLYSLGSNFRVTSHQLYYQAASGIKHNLMVMESLELKVQLSASTEVYVIMSGTLRTFSILMVREEVSSGVYNIVRHFKHKVQPDKLDSPPKPAQPAFLRRLPRWLLEVQLEGFDCSVETAGVDKHISKQTRGVALQLESWSAAYHSQPNSNTPRRPAARRKTSSSVRADGGPMNVKQLSSPPPSSKKQSHTPSDGRRLAVHVKGFEGFIIESIDRWESQPFLSLPRFEVAFTTSRDLQGPIFHINSSVRALYLYFSLYRFYSIGVAGSVLKDAFVGPVSPHKVDHSTPANFVVKESETAGEQIRSTSPAELVAIDFKASLVQVKGDMPADPPMLLQIYEVAAGRHRWSAPFLRAGLLRLHAEAPHLKRIWARLASVNNIRVDMRQSRRKTSNGFVEDRALEISTDFIRLAIPHGLVTYKVFDNFVNTLKAIAQLRHRFKTRTNEYILQNEPENAKHVPKVSLRSRALMFELEDDPFEWKLGTIYHIGQAEQKQRIARAEAFRVKLKRLNDDRAGRPSSRLRTQSTRPSSRDGHPSHPDRRARSQDSGRPRGRSRSRGRNARQTGRLRYDREGVCSLTGTAKVHAQDAWQKLLEHNARSWKRRIDGTLALQNDTVKNIRRLFSGADEPPHDIDEQETILGIPNRPGLMSAVISDLHLLIDRPSFPLSELPNFLHEIGKGMPRDMKYSLLIPMNITLNMGEARVMLRDYPLNLLHVPSIRPGQPPRLPSWSLRTDFVIAEEFRDEESSRHVKVDIVPGGKLDENGREVPGFAIDVRRTVSPVKTYSKPTIDINTSLPTSISWGPSYQPVIQDMMMIIEGFTKPEIDPSDRVGFWDKFRLNLHSRLTVNWKGDGDVQLRLKGKT